MIAPALLTSNRADWETPKSIVKDLSSVFDWDLDVCASRPNVCERYCAIDSLDLHWSGLCWMNPPYGRQIGKWMRKARMSGATVVCLVPARTDTKWWHENVVFADLVVFIRGRIHFEIMGEEAGASPFPCAFVVFGELNHVQKGKLGEYGWIP